MVIVPVGANGQISIYNNTGSVDVVVDVLGWFPTGDSYTGLTPARQMDTRIPDPLPAAAIGPIRNLLVVRPVMHQMSGADRIAVWVCDVPADASRLLRFQRPAAASYSSLSAWPGGRRGTLASGTISSPSGRYEPTFIAMGHIPLSTTDGPYRVPRQGRGTDRSHRSPTFS